MDLHERIARLEVSHQSLEDKHQDILVKLEGIQQELIRYKGFLGGIAFIISSMVIAWNIAKDWIVSHLK